MDKKFIDKQKQKLLASKERIQGQLSSIAKQSVQSKDDWEAKVPSFAPSANLEEAADEVEEFNTRLSLEKTLETELVAIHDALDKIKKGKYGICAKCHKPIAQGRLMAYPRASICMKCQ